jgi:glycosyltransferase involved in cell wall biosynthesis/GT2 family glycosyltransferase
LIYSIRRLVARRPLDWTRGAGRPPAKRPDSIDIIIPVYGAADELRPCIESVAHETDLTRHRLILVVDGPQDDAVESIVAASGAIVLRNERRLGFVGAVNRGMRESTSDVVLLNSDTIVTSRWIEKLIEAAYSSPDIGTVTPLSNHATLCSVPQAFEENLLPSGFDVASFAALIESTSARSYPRLPTGVGFCLYIRRALLDDIGFFDSAKFGFGYGEENDFCMRALSRGWLNIADDATFIYHAGNRSFGSSRTRLRRRAQTTLRRLHPRYLATIAAFMKSDPMADVRARIRIALGGREWGVGSRNDAESRQPITDNRQLAEAIEIESGSNASLRPPTPDSRLPVILHLVHGWPPFQHAGTELYAYWLAQQQKAAHDVAVYVRAADPTRMHGETFELFDDGVRVRFITNNFTARNPFRRNAIRDRLIERDFERFLRDTRPDLLHIHHLAGHTFSLAGVAKRLGIPIVLQIQDWWFLCARVNLYDRDGNRCSGPSPAKCARCATLTTVAPASLNNRLLHDVRRSAARSAIRACDVYVAGSEAIRDDYIRAGVIPESKPFHVLPYGVRIAPPVEPRALWTAAAPAAAFGAQDRVSDDRKRWLAPAQSRVVDAARRPIRFGYVGSISPHKGIHVAVDAMREIDPSEASLHIWGDVDAFPDYACELRERTGAASVIFEGRFNEEDKPRVFASMDVLLVPSIGLESFGLAAREAMTCGVPVIASEGGALSEMFKPGQCGEFFLAGDSAALRRILLRVVDNPSIIDLWSANIPLPKRDDVHAREIERVYDSVLAAHKS